MKAARLLVHLALAAAFALPAVAQPVAAPPAAAVTLFQDVRVLDGTGASLSVPSFVLVRGNRIERISTTRNLTLIENPARNFVVIMKDGKVHKNLLTAGR